MAKNVDEKGNLLKYEGFPFIYNIDKFVQDELSNRSFDRVRAITPFIKATPGFTLDGSESSKVVLKGIETPNNEFHSTYSFKELYRPDSNFRPLAGIQNLSIGYLNEFGSVKKATLTWVCHTLEDLERLSPYFLNPGMTMLLEWGWSNYANIALNNSHLLPDNSIINLKNSNKYIKNQRLQSNGNYDAMLGVIVNYSFRLNKDGGFDCTTEVVSAGYLMEGITLPYQFTREISEEQKQEDIKNEREAQNEKVLKPLQEFIKTDFYAQIKNDLLNKNNIFTDVTAEHDYFLLAENGTNNGTTQLVDRDSAKIVTAEKTVDYPDGSSNTEKVDVTLRASVYASWGYLEDYVINPHLAATDDKGVLLFSFDSRGVKIASHRYLRTTDLGVCIVPIPNDKTAVPVPNFRNNEPLGKNPDFGYIRRLLINVEYFREVFLSSKTVNEAVLKLFAGINNACINYWRFSLIPIDDKFDYTSDYETKDTSGKSKTKDIGNVYNLSLLSQKVVDINYSENLAEILSDKNNIYVFRTKTYSLKDPITGQIIPDVTSVLRDVSFESKLSSQAAMNVFWSAHRSDGTIMGTPNTNTFQGLYDFSISSKDYSKARDTFAGPFKIATEENNTDPSKKNDTVDPGTEIGTETDLSLVGQSAYGDKLTHYLPWGSSDPSKSKGYWIRVGNVNLTGIEGMKIAILTGDENGNPPAKSEALVPLNMNIEIEGISGFRIGDLFTLDHLPTIYREHGTFQITGITDSITKNSWVTSIKAGYRVYKNRKYNTSKNNPQTTDRPLNQSNVNVGKKSPVTPPSELVLAMKRYNITSTLEKSHFLSQCATESGGFNFTKEFASGTSYEGRKDLGNIYAGDGEKYKGRGYIQLTGRHNYQKYQDYLKSKGYKDDIMSNPDLVEEKFAADSACFWWKNIGRVTPYALQGSTPEDVLAVTKKVNGGSSAYGDRLARFNGYWDALKKDSTLYT